MICIAFVSLILQPFLFNMEMIWAPRSICWYSNWPTIVGSICPRGVRGRASQARSGAEGSVLHFIYFILLYFSHKQTEGSILSICVRWWGNGISGECFKITKGSVFTEGKDIVHPRQLWGAGRGGGPRTALFTELSCTVFRYTSSHFLCRVFLWLPIEIIERGLPIGSANNYWWLHQVNRRPWLPVDRLLVVPGAHL